MKYIPDDIWNAFRHQFIDADATDIAQGGSMSLIIVTPEARIPAFKDSPRFNELRRTYSELVRQYTHNRVKGPESIIVTFLTKEEFDGYYKGDWYLVFR